MLTRYQYPDAYTLQEFEWEYASCDWRGRIRLLRRLNNGGIPDGIIALGLKDEHTQVRSWLARHAHLSDPRRDQVLQDSDPFVRASLRENEQVFSGMAFVSKWRQWFTDATPLERLALIRNPEVSTDLIERVFDSTDAELGISLEEREKLAIAALTNAPLFQRMEQEAGLRPRPFPHDGYGWYLAHKFLRNLWDNASAWPDVTWIRYLTYRHIPADDDVKAAWYEKSPTPLRNAILENCGPQNRKTLELAMNDREEVARSRAYATVGYLTDDQVEALIGGEDYLSLDAACCNSALKPEARQKILKRLRDLGHNDEPWLDKAEAEIKSAIERRKADSETDDLTEEDLDPSQECDERDLDGEKRDLATVVDNRVIAEKIVSLSRRQRRFERRLARRLTLTERVMAGIWTYAATVSELVPVIIGVIGASWLAFITLPGWLAIVAFLLIIFTAEYMSQKKLAAAQKQAVGLFSISERPAVNR
jgi:hypothetical protein